MIYNNRKGVFIVAHIGSSYVTSILIGFINSVERLSLLFQTIKTIHLLFFLFKRNSNYMIFCLYFFFIFFFIRNTLEQSISNNKTIYNIGIIYPNTSTLAQPILVDTIITNEVAIQLAAKSIESKNILPGLQSIKHWNRSNTDMFHRRST